MSRKAHTEITSIRHKDKRKNIPTEELRDFVSNDEHAPASLTYPRDPSLDPQLVWRGKDEQDQNELSVPVVPIYIQEQIHPQAIIDCLPRVETSCNGQPSLFADFNCGPSDFEKKVDFYHHEQNWSNRLILGDSLLVMASIADKEGLKGKVQSIFFDPPYGIRFGSNWQVSTRKREVKDKAEDATRQPEQIRAFRDTWKLGIHSYLSYIRDRLVVARELLTETGSIFVQIGDENVHLVRNLLDEVFGSENFIATIAFKKKKMPLGETYIFTVCDYLLWYGKDAKHTKFRKLFLSRDAGESGDYGYLELPDGQVVSRASASADQVEKGKLFQSMDMRSSGRTESCVFEYAFGKHKFFPSEGKSWKTNLGGMRRLHVAGRLFYPGDSLRYKLYFDDYPVQELSHMWMDTQGATDKEYVVQTNTKVVERCLLMTTDPGDLVFDPTCGSGTTAYVAEQWGRRWITCDTSRVALALARTRLMSARFPYYLLADSPEGIRKETDFTGKTSPPEHSTANDVRKGFVYQRVSHITLGSISNNPDIQEGMSRQEIDAAIAKHAETETLYDQPEVDNKRIRVCGPFSVESLSPHRTISIEEKKRRAEVGRKGLKMQVIGPDNFGHMVLENLRKAGVQNTRKAERLKFDTLDPYAGEWIHGQGTFTESATARRTPETSSPSSTSPPASVEQCQKRVAVCIGPEHGTVGASLIKEAAKEAVKGVGFDVLIVCGFAFDPSVSEEVKRYGKLTVLPTKMNPDLAMGDELLKKTGAGNLFMVFGEPDVEIRKVPLLDGRGVRQAVPPSSGTSGEQFVVEIKGLDVYDPTTGAIRNSSTDDIACWFIDTDYDEDSFFVRHAYFTGADEPYERLKRALRAEIDESAWSALYSTTSQPFPLPTKKGKIAVKVINHYGDEVLKVYDLRGTA